MLDLEHLEGTIEVIVSKDKSVGCSPEEYQEYLKTLDEALLQLKPGMEPTRFVMKKTLDWKTAAALKKSQVKMSVDAHGTHGEINIAYQLDEVRYALVDIKNAPTQLKFVKDSDGFVSKDIVAKLDALKVVEELCAARNHAVADKQELLKKS